MPYAVSDPELAHAIVTGGLMWPGAVEVRVKRPGLKARSRRSYVASAEGTTD